MVNQWTGEWMEEKDYTIYPKEKWCDYDYMADWIRKIGYKIKTTMENLITMIFLHFYCELDDCGKPFTIDGCKQYVEDSGGLKEFDYYC